MNKFLRLVALTAFGAMAISLPVSAPAQDQPHGDHNAHHGGVVLMYGLDLHYEVVLLPTGKVQLWLSDAARSELPASVVSDVAVELERPGAGQETVDMAICRAGDCWEGQGKALGDKGANLHLAFLYRGQQAVLSFPSSALMGQGKEKLQKETSHAPAKADPHAGHEGHGHHEGHDGHE